jgi:hypothetical protein
MLMRFDVPSPETISFEDASRIIDQHMVSFSQPA